jgi:organic radical activating enzyme
MFGTNKVRGVETRTDGLLRVQAKWKTIQGEGPLAGRVSYFIRLAGCNLRCAFCDTDFESNYDNLESIEQIADWVKEQAPPRRTDVALEPPLVIITGGEPFLQYELIELCKELVFGRHYHVQIETAGTVWLPHFHDFLVPKYVFNPARLVAGVSVVVSPKTPKVTADVAAIASAWKYIVRVKQVSSVDGLPCVATQAGLGGMHQILARPPEHILFGAPELVYVQPCWEELNETKYRANVAECVRSSLRFGYRVSLQQHRYLDVE